MLWLLNDFTNILIPVCIQHRPENTRRPPGSCCWNCGFWEELSTVSYDRRTPEANGESGREGGCRHAICKWDIILRDWSLITGRGGATKWENRGSETFCAPPPKTG